LLLGYKNIVLKSQKGIIHIFFLLGLVVVGLVAFFYFFYDKGSLLGAQTNSPIFRASSVVGSGGTKVTSLVVNSPTGVVDGDILITQVLTYTTSANITTPAGWTLISKNTSGTGGGQIASSIYWKKAASEPASYTWNFGVLTFAGVDILAYYNALEPTSPYEFNFGTQNSNQVTSQGVTTSVDNEMLIYFGGIMGTGVISTPTGMTQRLGGSSGPQVAEQVIATAGSTGSRTGVASATGNNVGQLLAIKPIPDPTPTPNPTAIAADASLFITFRDKSTSIIGNANSVTVNKPAGLQSNDLMLSQIVLFNNPAASVTPPSGWNLIRSSSNGNYRSILYWKRATTSEPNSYVWNLSASAASGGGIVAYINAANPVGTAPYDSNFSSQNSTQVTTNGVATYVPNEMLVYFGMIAASTTITTPSGMIQRYSGNFIAADQIVESIAETTGSRTGVAGLSGANIGQLVALVPGGSVTVPMNSGTITETATNAGCGVGDNNCLEHIFNVNCQNIPTRQITIREYNNSTSPKKGAVIFTTGVEGYLFYSDLDTSTLAGWNEPFDNPKQTRIQTQANGFKAYELAWTDSNQTGWKTNTDPSGAGLRKAMCGYAAAVKWISENEGGTSEALCTQGNSAGASQIAYGLSHYGLDQYLDLAIITGGPPHARPDIGHGSGTCNDPLNYASRFLDYVMGWKNKGDYAAKDCGNTGFTRSPMPATALRALAIQSIAPDASNSALLSYQGSYNYPQTRINFIQGPNDPAAANGQYYVSRVMSQNGSPNPGAAQQYTTQYPSLPTGGDYSHLVDQYNQGADIIRNLIESECHNWNN
jgi:hypothetical protein